MHGDDNKHNIKEMECKLKEKNAKENKIHEHNTKEIACKRKDKKCTRNKMYEDDNKK